MIVTGNAALNVAKSFSKALSNSVGVESVATSDKFSKFKGGYFKEPNGDWIAFDNHGGEWFVEPFDSKEQAKLYANGIEARTKYGLII